jgi:L-aspartate oxidase
MSIDRAVARAIAVRRHRAIVIGAGVAGTVTALGLGQALLLSDTGPGRGGSSPLAQGGAAAALGPDDDPTLHAADTVAVAGGLAAPRLVEVVTGGAPEAIAQLVARGARFDRDGRARVLTLGREAGHRRNRIVHADGDATGAEIMRVLGAAVEGSPGIETAVGWTAIDLVRRGRRVVGVVALGPGGELVVHLAAAVVLATGGYGHAFARTSAPPEARGDGIALAARAGAAVADMEFVQFHPTALAVEADPLPLLTEALRGEGAVLIDRYGHRFMLDEHPDVELAPRDVVARAVYRRVVAGDGPLLDARGAVGERFPERFPTVHALAARHGLDPRTEPLPVTPAAHYTMGGVATDDRGRTTVAGLWAVGEVASSGLHGANRLASNSLIEGLVLGRRVAEDILADGPTRSADDAVVEFPERVPSAGAGGDAPRVGEELRTLLWSAAGVERAGPTLAAALDRVDALAGGPASPGGHPVPVDNALTVARLVLEAAMARTESRGAHHRRDHPTPDPAQAERAMRAPEPVPTRSWTVDRNRDRAVPAGWREPVPASRAPRSPSPPSR